MEQIKVYKLSDPRTGHPRYVGVTSLLLSKRKRGHLNEAKRFKSNTHKIHWLRELLSLNLSPKIRLIKRVPKPEWEYWEKFYIAKYREKYDLTNTRDGGAGTKGRGKKWDKAMRDRMERSIAERKKLGLTKLSPEHRSKLKGPRPHTRGINHPKVNGVIIATTPDGKELKFVSIAEAATQLNLTRKNVSAVIHKAKTKNKYIRTHVKGYTFRREI